jgi:uncharacterized protein (TIGR00299 family) protein
MAEDMTHAIVYLDCSAGISGDMFLGALLDAGLSLESLRQALGALALEGYIVECEPCSDRGLRGSRFRVLFTAGEQPARHLSDIKTLLEASTLAPRVRESALSVFQRLAEAEAEVHGTSLAQVHFHEVGAVDALVDIVGACWAIETLGLARVYASPLPLSSGQVQSAHGLLPVPAPATLEILRRVSAPWQPSTGVGEMVTPTGAALLATFAHFAQPAMTIERVGYGFGQKHFPWPNCLRVCLGRALQPFASAGDEPEVDQVSVLECNIDNMTGEQLGDLLERLLAAGALDAGYLPLHMKKNRPAVTLSLICQPEESERLARFVLAESGTLGIRMQQVWRRKAQRAQMQIDTPLGLVLVKVKRLGKSIISAAPEYEDCRRLARAHHLPLQEVYTLVQEVVERVIFSREGQEDDPQK